MQEIQQRDLRINSKEQQIRDQREIEKFRKTIVKLYVIHDEHVGSLWKCLGMTFDEYQAWKERP